jgi:hypothetical protein
MVLGHRELSGPVQRIEQALRVDHHCSPVRLLRLSTRPCCALMIRCYSGCRCMRSDLDGGGRPERDSNARPTA